MGRWGWKQVGRRIPLIYPAPGATTLGVPPTEGSLQALGSAKRGARTLRAASRGCCAGPLTRTASPGLSTASPAMRQTAPAGLPVVASTLSRTSIFAERCGAHRDDRGGPEAPPAVPAAVFLARHDTCGDALVQHPACILEHQPVFIGVRWAHTRVPSPSGAHLSQRCVTGRTMPPRQGPWGPVGQPFRCFLWHAPRDRGHGARWGSRSAASDGMLCANRPGMPQIGSLATC